MLRQYNALIGHRNEVKIFLLLFENERIGVSELQRIHWKGGNKNELVICASKDGSWAKTFSWCDDKRIEVESSYIFEMKELSLHDKIVKVEHQVEELWKRKHFKDFDYIDIPLNLSDLIWIFCVSLLLSIGVTIWAVKNEIEE